ncbi:DUF1353 domain-containing protein [Lentzea sp. NPDC051213]|uniref:DUF1353 domain-containing protein n=1 Tax=Lentzea sp. NPDC051213 TaxID=3364126 RepID=UPI003787BEC0
MVFTNPDGTPADKMELRVWSKTDFKLIKGFHYVPFAGATPIAVPDQDNENDDETTDLASVPWMLRGLLSSYGRQLRAALVHDHLCKQVTSYTGRHEADQLFLRAMRDRGDGGVADLRKRVPLFRALLFWAGVSFARYWSFRKLRLFLMTAQLLAGVAAVYAAAHVLPHRWFAWAYPPGWGEGSADFLLTFVAIMALSVVWGRDTGFVAVGVAVAPIILPVLLLTLIAQGLLSLPDFAIKIGSLIKIPGMANEPPAIIGPVVVSQN